MISSHRFIKLSDGLELHTQIKEAGKPVWLIATHGIGEHLGRHDYISKLFSHDFNLCQYDLRGHGRSLGEPAYVEDFSAYMRDLDEIIQFLKKHYKMERYILFGHSMGGLITLGYIQKFANSDFYPERVFVNAPPVGVGGPLAAIVNRAPLSVFQLFCKAKLSLKLSGLVDLNYLSHDVHVKEDYLEDQFNHSQVHSKLLFEMVKASKEIFEDPISPKCPAFVSYGTEDHVISPEMLAEYFDTVEKDFEVKVINGAYHEIHNEIDKYRKPYFEFLESSLMQSLYNSEE